LHLSSSWVDIWWSQAGRGAAISCRNATKHSAVHRNFSAKLEYGVRAKLKNKRNLNQETSVLTGKSPSIVKIRYVVKTQKPLSSLS
jgi:hypothetical protein